MKLYYVSKVFKLYVNLGNVFRDKNKRVYSMEGIQQLLINYYKKSNIDCKIKSIYL